LNFVIRHSCRSASIGSTFAARRAGIQQATSATTANSSATPILLLSLKAASQQKSGILASYRWDGANLAANLDRFTRLILRVSGSICINLYFLEDSTESCGAKTQGHQL